MTPFEPIFVPGPLRAALSEDAWLGAMLEAERAIAVAEAAAGVIPADAAAAIGDACRPELYDADALAEEGRADASPVVPLVRALRERVGPDFADHVHVGTTTQDVVDTASMLVARSARGLIAEELAGAAAAAAALAEAHRSTPIAARTLMQQALPTTFGLKAAGWLVAIDDARRRLVALPLPVQLGGAAGTLGELGEKGLEVRRLYAAELGLVEPLLPWHVHREPVAELGAALDAAATACGKAALDVVLLAQTEVAEVAEGSGGGSSALPHKRNAAAAVLARACARLAHANAVLLGRGEYEHERAAGAWQAEWPALSAALAFTGGAAAAVRRSLEGLRVDPERMAANIAVGEGNLATAESLVDRALARYRDGL